MRKLPTTLIPVLLLGLIAVAGICVSFLTKESPELVSARQGGEWLLSYKTDYKDPGILWVVYSLNTKFCKSDTIGAIATERFTREFAAKPIERAYAPLVGLSTEAPEKSLALSMGSNVFDDIIMPALYCKEIPIASTTEQTILSVDTASGYTLTHKFLAMLFMRERECLSEEGEQALNTAAHRMSIEQSQAVFDDIYAERVAFLLYGGFNSLVDDSWITTIISNQEKSGGWKTIHHADFFGASENPHTSALAVLALSLHTRTCPFAMR